MQAAVTASTTVRTPGGRAYVRTSTRTATLADPTNLLSLRTYRETTTTNGLVDAVSFDAATRAITYDSAAGRRATVTVDGNGRPVQTRYANLSPGAITYDGRGRPDTATLGAGTRARVSRLEYGTDGYLARMVDPLGRVSTLISDGDGRVIEQQRSGGSVVALGYDAIGNLAALTPPGKPAHAFGYTERSETSLYTPPAVGAEPRSTGFGYDRDGRPLHIERGSETIDFSYDGAGRLSRVDLPSDFRAYSYDEAGWLLSATTGGGVTLGYAHDAWVPTATTWSGAVAGTVSRAFDQHFRVTAVSVNGADAIANAYDADGLLTQTGAIVMTRDPASGLVTATTLGAVADATAYDEFGAVASYSASLLGAPIYAVVYDRDALGRIIDKTETIAGATHAVRYEYDAASRLAQVRRDGALAVIYSYDANGNRVTVTDADGTTVAATYDAQDRLIRHGAAVYAHTAAGDRQSKMTAAGTTAYRHDALGTLTGVTLPDGRQIDYLLDGQGRRVGKKIGGALSRAFLYQDDLRPIVELDGAGAVRSRFVYADRGSAPEYMISGGHTYRIIVDHLGSPRLVIDVASGDVAQELDYDAFGNVILDTQPGFQPFGFAGGIYDPDTRLTRFGVRDYDAETGRWTTKDPIGFLGGDTNLYGYVANDPINSVDVAGMGAELISRLPAPGSPVWNRVYAAVLRAGVAEGAAPGITARLFARYGVGLATQAATPGALPSLISRLPQAGAAGTPVMVGLASFTVGFAAGTLLDRTFCLSRRMSDALTAVTQLDPAREHAVRQFIENRGGDVDVLDLAEFMNRCGGGGAVTAFCAGYGSR
jgi:RHS repeat-associated protein